MKVFLPAWAWGAALWVALGGAVAAEAPAGVLAEGTRWETPWYTIDSGVEGPTVFLTGGLHGNEPAGWRAAEQVRRWPIVKEACPGWRPTTSPSVVTSSPSCRASGRRSRIRAR